MNILSIYLKASTPSTLAGAIPKSHRYSSKCPWESRNCSNNSLGRKSTVSSVREHLDLSEPVNIFLLPWRVVVGITQPLSRWKVLIPRRVSWSSLNNFLPAYKTINCVELSNAISALFIHIQISECYLIKAQDVQSPEWDTFLRLLKHHPPIGLRLSFTNIFTSLQQLSETQN